MGLVFYGNHPTVGCAHHPVHLACIGCFWETCSTAVALLNERSLSLAGPGCCAVAIRPGDGTAAPCRLTASVFAPSSASPRAGPQLKFKAHASAFVAWVVQKTPHTCPFFGCSGESRAAPIPTPNVGSWR